MHEIMINSKSLSAFMRVMASTHSRRIQEQTEPAAVQAARSKSGSRLARLAEEQAEEDQQRAESSGQAEDGQGKQGRREPGGEDGDSDGSGPKVSQGESLPHPPPSCSVVK